MTVLPYSQTERHKRMEELFAWLTEHVEPLLCKGERVTITLHIAGDDIRADVERKGLVIRSSSAYSSVSKVK